MAKSNTGKIEGHQARSADQRALVFGAGVSEVVKQNRIGSFCSPSFLESAADFQKLKQKTGSEFL